MDELGTPGPGARQKHTDGSRAVKKSDGMSYTIHTAGEKFTQCRRFVRLSSKMLLQDQRVTTSMEV